MHSFFGEPLDYIFGITSNPGNWLYPPGWALAQSEEAKRYNERERLLIARDHEKKNGLFIYDDVQ